MAICGKNNISKGFQFLIGRLKTLGIAVPMNRINMFQFLIGRLKTW